MRRWLVVLQSRDRGELMDSPVIVEATTPQEARDKAHPAVPNDRRVWAVHVYELAQEHHVTQVHVRSPEWGQEDTYSW